MKTFFLSYLTILIGIATSSQTTIVPYSSNWKYFDKGTNQGTAWRSPSFNDASWASGNAQLGYGDGDETTVLSYGPDASKKYITTYFRKTISVPDTSLFSSYTLNIIRDDGAVVYINGLKVFSTNMPAGSITYTSLASAIAGKVDENTPQSILLPVSKLKKGTNIIAVEIHQFSVSSVDISFDLQLKGNAAGTSKAALVRGPYLNLATQNSIIIRYRTNIATNSEVNYGTNAQSLNRSVVDTTKTTEHIVKLTGLSVNTKYYYSIGSTTQTLQGDINNYFKTMPIVGSTQKVRILAMGDMGNNSTNEISVRNAYLNYTGNAFTDIWMLLGDNAYNSGLDSEYQTKFFNIYQGNISKNHVLWPVPGNHDYANSSTRQADHKIPYYNIFSLPTKGEAGGLASNTKAYYSYNYGNIHFVALDSYGWETASSRLYDTTGPQVTWLKQDLAANKQLWTIVAFHHPPYTKGSHNSDTEMELINLRQRLVRILERYKVDLVLNGHSHDYERSYLINGHYGLESTFSLATHALSSSSAKYNGSSNSCPYIKNSTDIRNGIVFAVVGSAGRLNGGSPGYPHNAMQYSDTTYGGSLIIEIQQNRLDAKWACSDGVIRDNFTIMKEVNKTNNISIPSGSPTTLTASWIGTYLWSTGATTRSITVMPTSNKTYSVTDNFNCLKNLFNITTSSTSLSITQAEKAPNEEIKVYPSPLKSGRVLFIKKNSSDLTQGIIYDVVGREMKRFSFTNTIQLSTEKLKAGIYRIVFRNGDKSNLPTFTVVTY